MDRAFVDAVRQLSPLAPYLRAAPILGQTKERVVAACFDRAVLLPEIPDGILRNCLRIPEDEISALQAVGRQIQYDLHAEIDTPGKYLPKLEHRQGQSYDSWLTQSRPEGWTWLEMAAGGVRINGWHMGVALECVFEETKALSGSSAFSFRDRCRASGLSELIPSAIVDRSAADSLDNRMSRGPPRKRIKAMRAQSGEGAAECWRFVGHIQRESSLRTQLASIEASWKTTRSAWHAWAAFQDTTTPGAAHFAKITEAQLGSFSSCFDTPSTLKKYFSHIRKAALLLGCEFPSQTVADSLLRGSSKFVPRPTKSYITARAVAQMTEQLVRAGKVELAQFVSVVYTYQLRVQSEAVALQFDGRKRAGSAAWHSAVELDSGQVTILLRVRKNSLSQCRIARKCICGDWPNKVVCGVCSLKRILLKSKAGGACRVFPNVRTTDINILKEIGRQRDLGTVTWHGFRRGRTVDLLQRGGANGACVSLADLYESGGWKYGSHALLSYLPEDAVNRERVFKLAAEASDTEDDS